MTHSSRRWLIALLLPMLALRVLLPAGYMPAPGGELVMCPHGMPPTAHAGDSAGAGEAGERGKCPFAAALFKAAPPQFQALFVTASAPCFLTTATTADHSAAAGPARANAARAPPTPA